MRILCSCIKRALYRLTLFRTNDFWNRLVTNHFFIEMTKLSFKYNKPNLRHIDHLFEKFPML